ncbi:TrmH family RNA methyltransferase, partial [Candidatus Nomurabacteria bacterium]|nr:TrmH family RNA methyltransferase [Candidatus Nomurabacteria bacterium]
SMFRTCDAVGVNKVYIVGYTPTPIDKFGRKRSDIAKASLGAEDTIKWEYRKTLPPLLKSLKKEGYKIIAIEQSKNSVDYRKIKQTPKMVFVMGNEVDGLPESILKICDYIAEIRMLGKKESLNVSVACGVALFGIIKK